MGAKVTYTHPAYPKGHVFALNGLGELPNGEAIEFDDDQVANFELVTGVKLKDAVSSNKMFKLESAATKKGGDD